MWTGDGLQESPGEQEILNQDPVIKKARSQRAVNYDMVTIYALRTGNAHNSGRVFASRA